MKTTIHPTYHPSVTVKCACGATFVVGSTKDALDVEVCSACHPFFVGDDSKKVLAGRLEKFKNRQATVSAAREAAQATAKKRAAKKVTTKKSEAAKEDTEKEAVSSEN